MKRIFFAVMLCTFGQPKKIIALGIRVRDLLFTNIALFATPPLTLVIYKAALDKLIASQAAADKGGKLATATRDADELAFFLMLNPLLLNYVNGLYKGDKEKLLASGFYASNEPNPKEAPSIPVISRMVMTDLALHVAKIYLAPFPKPVNGTRGVVNYIVQIAIGPPTEENFKTILIITNSRKLFIPNLDRGVETHVRICASNARGTSAWSTVEDFMPA